MFAAFVRAGVDERVQRGDCGGEGQRCLLGDAALVVEAEAGAG